MEANNNLKEMEAKIKTIKETAEQLNMMADEFPALSRNLSRIMAGVKMLELNISDIVDGQ